MRRTIAAALLLASCATEPMEPTRSHAVPAVSVATPPSPTAPSVGRGEPSAAGPVEISDNAIATVDGAAIRAGDAFELLRLAVPDEAANAIRQLIVDRLCRTEAAQAGIAVPAELVEREFARMVAGQERKVKEASKGRQDLAAYAKQALGLDPAVYLARVRDSVERSLLLERVVLLELGQRERIQLRLIRVKERPLAEEIRRKLVQGADFAVLARTHSEDAAAREGGLYPPLPADLPSPLFERAAKLAPAALSEIEELSTSDGPRYRIVQLLSRLPAEPGEWSTRAPAIEKLLDGRPLSPLELEAWLQIMEDRHAIRGLGRGQGATPGTGN